MLSRVRSAARDFWWVGLGALVVIVLFVPRRGSGSHYDAVSALRCLGAGDRTAGTVMGRYVAVDVLGARLNIAFEPSGKKAMKTEAHYKVVAGHAPTSRTVARDGNVVLVWDRPPTDRERSAVEHCLRHASSP
jgi:hypothetical protein